jgi:hypothetical protein
MSRVASFLVMLLLPTSLAAADLRVTDSSGTQVIVKDAAIDYPAALGSAVRESNGIRVLQGEAIVTMKWKDVQSLQVLGADGGSKPERLGVDVRLRNGRQVSAALQHPADAKLRGKTELGEYVLDLYKVRSIKPLR